MQIALPKRQSEIDFLRGLAIILVLFRHYQYIPILREMGWIGVDLFFVLSGFLVSGLLFNEYNATGKIAPWRFLIRRGFKIYPVFYTFTLFYIVFSYINHVPIPLYNLIGELFFLQNYVGSLWNHTWSLAIEEHFYILLILFILLSIRYSKTESTRFFTNSFLIIAVSCLILRLISNYNEIVIENLYYTHLRIDSLFFGVLMAHWYHFRFDQLKAFVTKYKNRLLIIFFICIFYTPFIELNHSFFIRTFGFTLLFIGFGALLLFSLFSDFQKLSKKTKISSLIYKSICKTGQYSYSIYIIHIFVSISIKAIKIKFGLQEDIAFIIYFICTLSIGIIISKLIEIPFLHIREKYFPKVTPAPVVLL